MQQLTLPGFHIPIPSPELALTVLAFLDRRDYAPTTLALYRAILRRFEAWRAGRPISALLVAGYLATYRHRAPDTQQNVYRCLRAYCRFLQLTPDPFTGPGAVVRPKLPRRRRRTYTSAEVVALLVACGPAAGKRQRWATDGPRAREQLQARALVLLLVDSALRADEVARLTCGQVRAPALVVRGKGGHEDRVHITAVTRDHLLMLAGDRPAAEPLFRNWLGGRCTTDALRGIIERLAVRANVDLPPRCLHAFRHLAAQNWARAGLPDLVIKRLMRHANLATTQIYTDGARDDEIAELHARVSPVASLLAAADGE